MTPQHIQDLTELIDRINAPLAANDLPAVVKELEPASPSVIVELLERLSETRRAVVYRLLPKQEALEVFEALDPALQSELIHGLQDAEVAALFADLDPDDRVWLLDELPASLASRLVRGLSPKERHLTNAVLGYPRGSIGRRMSPEYMAAREEMPNGNAYQMDRERLDDVEPIYTLPVVDSSRKAVGVVGLRDLMAGDPEAPIRTIMREPRLARVDEDEEIAARRLAEQGLLALPIVDSENRLVGILTIDDAVRILEKEETEDSARQGGVEPLHRPYLSTPTTQIVRSRIVWLLVLAVGAALTVQVLSYFEATIAQVTVLSLFVPLLIGTGGNTGNQAATTVTRAMALNDVRPGDILKVLGKELRVGITLGAILGLLGFAVMALVFELSIGIVIGLTLLAVCTMAATVGGGMPLIARALKVDPAVFSNPFITTFVDATGLVIYFLIAKAVLGI